MKIPLKRYWSLLHTYLRPQWPRIILLGLLLAVKIALRLVNPQIVRVFLDQAFAGAQTGVLLRNGAAFFAIAAAAQLVTIMNVYVGELVAWTATNALRLDLLRHLLGLDMTFHKTHTPGELTERVDSDVDALSTFFSQFVLSVLGNGILAAGVLVLMYREGWQIGASFTVYAIAGLLILMRLRHVAIPHFTKVREMRAQFYGFVGEQFSGTEDIRANGAQAYVMHRFTRFLRLWLPIHRNAALAAYSGWMTNAGLVAAGEAIAYGLGGYLFLRGDITLGAAYLISDYMGMLFGQIAELRWHLTELQQADAGIDRIQELLETRSPLIDGSGGPLPAGALGVSFRGVSFAYADAPPGHRDAPDSGGSVSEIVEREEAPAAAAGIGISNDGDRILHDLNFSLAPGRVLGLLGRTGSGKTTLARLLLRLYDPTEGEVCLANTPLTDLAFADIRRRVALVTQEVQLFQASVRDNLTLFRPGVSDDEICAVLENLDLASWLNSLPEGLDTELASGGGGLSAGQAQLLALARVFLAKPDLVILDEASSRLDPATEYAIDRAINLLLTNRTGIIIAHRLNTVDRADDILILEERRIREMGNRARLAQNENSYFYHLLQTGMQDVLV